MPICLRAYTPVGFGNNDPAPKSIESFARSMSTAREAPSSCVCQRRAGPWSSAWEGEEKRWETWSPFSATAPHVHPMLDVKRVEKALERLNSGALTKEFRSAGNGSSWTPSEANRADRHS